MTDKRDTPYAREIATGRIIVDDSEARIERIFIKEHQRDEIRFSWWKNGNMMQRPLDVTEDGVQGTSSNSRDASIKDRRAASGANAGWSMFGDFRDSGGIRGSGRRASTLV